MYNTMQWSPASSDGAEPLLLSYSEIQSAAAAHLLEEESYSAGIVAEGRETEGNSFILQTFPCSAQNTCSWCLKLLPAGFRFSA